MHWIGFYALGCVAAILKAIVMTAAVCLPGYTYHRNVLLNYNDLARFYHQ